MQLLTSDEVRRDKWDNCVVRNDNGLVYASTIYLDHVCSGWKGLIFNDYEAVMPVCIHRKYNIPYIKKPLFSQQTGLIGEACIDSTHLLKILKNICRYGTINFNFSNGFMKEFCTEKTNYVLPLNRNYGEIFKNYKYNLKSDLVRAAKNRLEVVDVTPEEAIDTYREMLVQKKFYAPASAFNNFKKLCINPAFKGKVLAKKVIDAKGETLSTGLYINDYRRIINIAHSALPNGKRLCATHFLINEVIKEFAGSGLLFDFEGSDLPGVKQFYQKFSPVNQPYYQYKFNELPLLLKMLKK